MKVASFQMIRAGVGYNPVILVTPPDTPVDNPDAKYYEYSRIKDGALIAGWKPGEFNEISRREALTAFCGMADGWGFAELPETSFPSLESALEFVRKNSR